MNTTKEHPRIQVASSQIMMSSVTPSLATFSETLFVPFILETLLSTLKRPERNYASPIPRNEVVEINIVNRAGPIVQIVICANP